MTAVLTLAFVKEALPKAEFGDQVPLHFGGVCTDSRFITHGGLFVALHGDRFDGHAYVEEALKKGASAAIVAKKSKLIKDENKARCIIVDSPLTALQELARAHLETMPARRVALTGSTGKTSTKELIRHVLQRVYGADQVFASEGNFNNEIGLPLMALRVLPHHKAAVFEMGMNHFGEITRLASIVKPHVALITNMGTAHAGNLGGQEGVAKAKAELFEALGRNDIAIVNADDPRCLREASNKVKGRQIAFGKAPWADVRVSEVQTSAHGVELTLSYHHQSARCELSLLGAHNAINAAAAIAVAMALQADFSLAVSGLAHAREVTGRLCRRQLKKNILLLDDSYNANPESMESGLAVLSSFAPRRTIAVLGDMLELGANGNSLHRNIGAACAQKKISLLLACGKEARDYIEGAIRAGLAADRCLWVQDANAVLPALDRTLQPDDVVLVKGSHSLHLETVVMHVMQTIGV